MQETHNPPLWEDREVLVTSGAQEALGKIVEMVIEEGDGVIIPETCYTTLMAAVSSCLLMSLFDIQLRTARDDT